MDPTRLTAFADELEKIADAKTMAGFAAAGAAAAFAANYLATKGKPSLMQKATRANERVIAGEVADRKRTGTKPSFKDEMSRITAKPTRELADLAAKHPAKASLPAAMVGASTGIAVAKMLMK